MKGVLIRGDGIAASCCAHLLATAGFQVAMEKAERTPVPAVLLSARTQALIGDVFERGDLFAGLPRIEKRSVAWGPGSEPLILAHSAVIASEVELADRLRPSGLYSGPEPEMDWTILGSRPLPTSTVERNFGSRMASALRVELAHGIDTSTCWIESLECGWLFLIPGGGNAGWLLAVGGTHEYLLEQSRIVARLIEGICGNAGKFPASPRITDPLCGPGWLACGSAALAFDPLCGDGAGNAVREAILAAAIIRAEANGAREQDVLEHYRARLLAGFRKHLELCREFYAAGHSGSWWNMELDFLQEGIEWCASQMNDSKPFQYRLDGFTLQAISG
jgi:hypothetical protein